GARPLARVVLALVELDRLALGQPGREEPGVETAGRECGCHPPARGRKERGIDAKAVAREEVRERRAGAQGSAHLGEGRVVDLLRAADEENARLLEELA